MVTSDTAIGPDSNHADQPTGLIRRRACTISGTRAPPWRYADLYDDELDDLASALGAEIGVPSWDYVVVPTGIEPVTFRV